MKSRGTAVVTGGRRGIGGATALALAAQGYAVAVVDMVEDDDARETMQSLEKAGERAMFVLGDISDIDAASRDGGWLDQIEGRLGAITCLINNAGMNVPVRGDLLDTTVDVFDQVLGVNLRGTFFLTLAVAKRMAAGAKVEAELGTEGKTARSIFVVSSANASMVSPEKGAYCISKSALPMLAGLFAARLGEYGVDVYEIQPGLIKTKMNTAVWERYGKAIAEGASLTRRWGTPEDVGQVITSIATGLLPFTTGTMVPVGGGLHVHRL